MACKEAGSPSLEHAEIRLIASVWHAVTHILLPWRQRLRVADFVCALLGHIPGLRLCHRLDAHSLQQSFWAFGPLALDTAISRVEHIHLTGAVGYLTLRAVYFQAGNPTRSHSGNHTDLVFG